MKGVKDFYDRKRELLLFKTEQQNIYNFFLGPTERSFLANIESVVDSALVMDKLVDYITVLAAEDYLQENWFLRRD